MPSTSTSSSSSSSSFSLVRHEKTLPLIKGIGQRSVNEGVRWFSRIVPRTHTLTHTRRRQRERDLPPVPMAPTNQTVTSDSSRGKCIARLAQKEEEREAATSFSDFRRRLSCRRRTEKTLSCLQADGGLHERASSSWLAWLGLRLKGSSSSSSFALYKESSLNIDPPSSSFISRR